MKIIEILPKKYQCAINCVKMETQINIDIKTISIKSTFIITFLSNPIMNNILHFINKQ